MLVLYTQEQYSWTDRITDLYTLSRLSSEKPLCLKCLSAHNLALNLAFTNATCADMSGSDEKRKPTMDMVADVLTVSPWESENWAFRVYAFNYDMHSAWVLELFTFIPHASAA